MGVKVVDLSDLTDHPSPNYLFVLRRCQQECLAADAGLLIVESDVTVKRDTLQGLADGALAREDCGIAAAVTVDEAERVNYPYLMPKIGMGWWTLASTARFAVHCSLRNCWQPLTSSNWTTRKTGSM